MAELIDFGSKIQYSNESPMRWGSEQAISGANKIREYNRQRAVEKAVSDNYNPETQTLNEVSLGKQLAGQGFGGTAEQVINQFKADRTKMSSDVADAIGKDYSLIPMGVMTPIRFIEKWGNTVEASGAVEKLKADIAKETPTETVPTDSTKIASDIISEKVQTNEEPINLYATKSTLPKDYLGSVSNPATQRLFEAFKKPVIETPSEPMSDSSVVNVPGNGFVSKMPEGKLQDIIPETTYTTTKTGPSTTTNYLAIDADPEKLARMFPEISNNPQDIGSSTFSSEGMRQDEKDNLTRFLSREGQVKTGDTLEDSVARYEASKISSVARPLPPQPGKNQLEERARYAKELQEYPSKVAEAINTARKEMRGGYGEIQGTEQAKKNFETDRARVDDKNFFYGDVTKPAADRIFMIRREWNDIKQAAGNASDTPEQKFQKAWAAAVSMGKIDGNMTLENIVTNLVAMGAVPSRQSAIIKSLLETRPDWQNLAANKVADFVLRSNIGKTAGLSPTGASPEWIAKTRATFNGEFDDNNAYRLGMSPKEIKEADKKTDGNTTSGTKPTASGAIADKKAESNSKKGSSKPSAKPASPW